jgi:predicted nucleic acid-binding protein
MTMTTYLADSSAWIDHLRTPASTLRRFLVDEVAHTEPVAMEILSGAKDSTQLERLRRMLQGTPLLQFDSASDFAAATELRRTALRKRLCVGIVDCMILAVANRCEVTLLTLDRPQAELARALGLRAELLVRKI